MNRKNTRNTRDLGLGGAGKGDAPRSNFNAEWRTRFDAINWRPCCKHCGGTGKVFPNPNPLDAAPDCGWCFGTGKNLEGFERDGHKLVKRYK